MTTVDENQRAWIRLPTDAFVDQSIRSKSVLRADLKVRQPVESDAAVTIEIDQMRLRIR